ncbi:hypothetical protein PNOK_0010300 [Pyrrhoderma noxium]|uniref:Zn(2)-C6 fungal-type domain-containing protein n=1 Tax=Pyrrhoderma noxium TaxID=2282107 RepID=A0A286UTT8_9AGAM|nr:hypothetical protein PNOK_0010300 [Pyrrhoderma noxium]
MISRFKIPPVRAFFLPNFLQYQKWPLQQPYTVFYPLTKVSSSRPGLRRARRRNTMKTSSRAISARSREKYPCKNCQQRRKKCIRELHSSPCTNCIQRNETCSKGKERRKRRAQPLLRRGISSPAPSSINQSLNDQSHFPQPTPSPSEANNVYAGGMFGINNITLPGGPSHGKSYGTQTLQKLSGTGPEQMPSGFPHHNQRGCNINTIKDNRIPSLDGDGLEMSLDALLPPRQIQNPVAGLFPDFRPIWPPELNMFFLTTY